MTPYVTVLMPAYNAGPYIGEAIESILNQSYRDFEFLIVEDGSEDSTKSIIESYQSQDRRIKIHYNEVNKGLIYSLNKGLDAARGTYIARMDADDVSLPHRLETQVKFMDSNKDIAVSSAWMETLGKKRETIWESPVTHDKIMARMFCYNCLWHPVSIIRKSVLDSLDLQYNTHFTKAEDYKLWMDIAKHRQLANIPEVLHLYRIHEAQKTKVTNHSHKNRSKNLELRKKGPGIREELLMNFLSRDITLEEVEVHAQLFFEIPFFGKDKLEKVRKWVDFLISENSDTNQYTEPDFSRHLEDTFSRTKAKSFKYYCRGERRFSPKILWRLFFSGEKYYQGFARNELIFLVMNSLMFRKNKKYSDE